MPYLQCSAFSDNRRWLPCVGYKTVSKSISVERLWFEFSIVDSCRTAVFRLLNDDGKLRSYVLEADSKLEFPRWFPSRRSSRLSEWSSKAPSRPKKKSRPGVANWSRLKDAFAFDTWNYLLFVFVIAFFVNVFTKQSNHLSELRFFSWKAVRSLNRKEFGNRNLWLKKLQFFNRILAGSSSGTRRRVQHRVRFIELVENCLWR